MEVAFADNTIRKTRACIKNSGSLTVLLVLFVLLLDPGNAVAAGVLGKVVDDDGQPVAYASVFLGEEAVMTDAAGFFQIEGELNSNAELRCLMMGYQRTMVPLDQYAPGDTLNITLSEISRAGNREAAEKLVETIQAAESVRALLVDGQGWHIDEHVPRISHYPIQFETAPPDSVQIAWLCDLILEASRNECGEMTLCDFVPAYALQFIGESPPLDILVSSSCSHLWVERGAKGIPIGAGGGLQCIAAELKKLMEVIFEDGDR